MDNVSFIENKHIRVGLTLTWGGAITHVSVPSGPNIINSFDLGRQIQQSYYSGPANYQRAGKQKSKDWAAFPWNPIQTGDAFRNGSEVVEHRNLKNGLYVKTIPKLWPMDNDAGECIMETWITLLPNSASFSYRARLTNARTDKTQYRAANQEVPAIYVNAPWHRLITYIGDKPFTGADLSEIRNDHKEPWPWVRYLPTEAWAALVNANGIGIGVCTKHPMEFHGGFHGKRGIGDEKARPTGYMSPITTEILDHNIVYEYTCTFVVGSLDTIRATAKRMASGMLPSWNFKSSRQGWHYESGTDTGWPLKDKYLTIKVGNPVIPVRLIGPNTFWHAEEAGAIKLRISSMQEGKVTVYWKGVPPASASTKPSAWEEWRKTWFQKSDSVDATFNPGTQAWITLNLRNISSYKGGLTGLALDLPDGVTLHDVALVRE